MDNNKLESDSSDLNAACFSAASTIYHSHNDKSAEQAVSYAKANQTPGRYLAYRDIPFYIAKYVRGTKALDYGAGTGFSTQFLLEHSLDVTGVDISKEMLTQAIAYCPNTPFYLMQNRCIPLASNEYDFVFSSLVLFELGSEEEFIEYLGEAKRVMKDEGVLIAVTGSQEMYSKEWLGHHTDYPQNKNLKSGDLAKIYSCGAEIEFTDFYWTQDDYVHFFNHAGFQLIEIHYPLGKESDPYLWKDEKNSSPFVVFIAKKLA
jgi:ubiquinone/menaquinone biosynthesis C-methylase UbiE